MQSGSLRIHRKRTCHLYTRHRRSILVMSISILFVPEVSTRHGVGHIARSIYCLTTFFPRGHLAVPRHADKRRITNLFKDFSPQRIVLHSEIVNLYSVVVIDRRITNAKEWEHYKQMGERVVGVDTCGSALPLFDYIIDTLPRVRGPRANIRVLSPPLLSIAVSKKRLQKHKGISILIRFGGKTGDRLARRLASQIVKKCDIPALSITVVFASRAVSVDTPIKVRYFSENLRKELHRYDLIFTSFGVMALEAIIVGCGVALVNLSRYHAVLSRELGFVNLGIGRVSTRSVCKAVAHIDNIRKHSSVVRRNILNFSDDQTDFKTLLDNITENSVIRCPLCKKSNSHAVARFANRTYRRCRVCKIVFMHPHGIDPVVYDKNYFEHEYRKQYGRSYADDYEMIYKMGTERITHIRSLLCTPYRPSLLDVGCAYGHFLAAAVDGGVTAFGIDISADAIQRAESNLRYPVAVSDFLSFNPGDTFARERFDIITMWYVIEHFRDLEAVFDKARSLLAPSGILAFATPNGRSLATRRATYQTLRDSPRDHFTILEPRYIAQQLRLFGFRLRKLVIHGHHPELYAPLLRPAVSCVSSLFRLGSTFSVYAERTE